MVKKWSGARNTINTINTSVSKVAKHLGGAISLVNTVRGGETVDLSESQKELTIKITVAWHNILMLIIYEVIILIAIVLVCEIG